MTSLSEIVNYTNDFLRVREIGDWDNALNGLQIENSGGISKIGASVDASTRVLAAAAKQNVDLLVVHHGLFWPGLRPVTGTLCRQLKIAFENNIALYSAHLPLDLHPRLGNNAQLAAALGLKSNQPFAGSEIYKVAQEGIDTFITGEAPHWAAVAADELGMNLLLGGHYATEVFGVKALAAHLSKRFKVPWTFLDCPTGM